MFRIVILHEPVPCWEHILKKWKKCLFQYLNIEGGLHNAAEYTYSCAPAQADPSPYMHFDRMLSPTHMQPYTTQTHKFTDTYTHTQLHTNFFFLISAHMTNYIDICNTKCRSSVQHRLTWVWVWELRLFCDSKSVDGFEAGWYTHLSRGHPGIHLQPH